MPIPRRERTIAAVVASKRAKWSQVNFRDNREPSTKRLAVGGNCCWCGREKYHEWPGMAEGAPHPREDWEEDMFDPDPDPEGEGEKDAETLKLEKSLGLGAKTVDPGEHL
jgi:hypothetical protein